MTLIQKIADTQAFESSLPAAALVPAVMQQAVLDPIVIENERPGDADARESLLDRAFGPARFAKTCERLRAGRLAARGLSLVARTPAGSSSVNHLGAVDAGNVVGTVRLWHVDAGGAPALMLGPLAVDARYRCYGIGAQLVEQAIARSKALGHDAILLVGGAPYYARFGFDRRHTLALDMPGPVEDARFLGLELAPGALAQAKGPVRATGAIDLPCRRTHREPLAA